MCLGKCARWFPQVVPGAASEIATGCSVSSLKAAFASLDDPA
jgi:hypothetical protein